MRLRKPRRPAPAAPAPVQPTGAHDAPTHPIYAGLARGNVLPRFDDIDEMPLGAIVTSGRLA
ncbi:hypothetical protein [Rhodococcus sp. SGAir0479]|uniref:hypothetical protein n=1 Tax=Rhodococcus sp. SGAir0479 TaxID=2567884 RepID=UPI0010CCF3AD|nr:hypothetical protein [Rhodococcus sp. SGAir0479]QCQ91758.1 hypothetical protein E7742_11290 [Rhodococcus sp. SGAir0479]